MRIRFFGLAGWIAVVAAVGSAATAGRQPPGGEPRIVVSPDVLVSRDGDRPHVEIMVAANPRNANHLIAGAITFTRPDGGPATKAYVSRDGGMSWDDVAFPEQRTIGGADPQVAFTAAGTAIFATLAMGPDETGRTRAFLHSYRSGDEGRTWSDAYDLGASYDHPMLVADHTTGRFAGRLYMSVLYGREYSLGVFRSEDDGRSWIGPVGFAAGGGERGLNVDPMLVLRDGSVVAPFVDFPATPDQTERWTESRLWTVVSTDGGVTFSEPKRGPVKMSGDEIREAREGALRFRLGGWVLYGVDRSERFPDRIYAVWPDFGEGPPRVVIAWTDDRGVSWSAPEPVAAVAEAGAQQFQAAVAANPDGVLGVIWYEGPGPPAELSFHPMFAASLDGGETFTLPARVSTVASRPLGSGNLLPSPTTFSGPAGELRVSLLSAASRWLSGGDYMGLTAAADGTFHPVWADARDGVYRMRTARIRVEQGPVEAPTPVGPPRDVTRRIGIVTDPGAYDAGTGELDLWVRLENVSQRPIGGPIEVEIRAFGSGMGDVFVEYAPEVLNADRGGSGPGAVFVYDAALGTGRVLERGGVSGAVRWRLKLSDPIRIPDLHVFVTGREVAAEPR